MRLQAAMSDHRNAIRAFNNNVRFLEGLIGLTADLFCSRLGTIAGNVASTTFTPSYTVTVPPGTCALVPNVASIVGNGSSEADVTVCNTNTGALTIPQQMIPGNYKLTVTAEDIAHNIGTQEVQIEVLP